MEVGLDSAVFQDQHEGQEMILAPIVGHSTARTECIVGFFLLIDGEDVAPGGQMGVSGPFDTRMTQMPTLHR